MKIENWYVTDDGNPYNPPEYARKMIGGEVYGNPRFPDGHKIVTSSITKVDGRIVTTNSGSVYELGTPSPDYINWLKENNMELPTPECPIKIFEKSP